MSDQQHTTVYGKHVYMVKCPKCGATPTNTCRIPLRINDSHVVEWRFMKQYHKERAAELERILAEYAKANP